MKTSGTASGSALLVDHRASWIVVIVSTVVAFAIWLISRVINVVTEITEELGAKVVEIANKRVPRPFRFLFLAPSAGQPGTHPGGSRRLSRRSSARSSKGEKVTRDHPIFTRWPAQYPDRLQLFSAPDTQWGEGRHHA